MTPEDLGYTKELENYRKEHRLDHLEVGRVAAEHKDRYSLISSRGEYDAELLGNIRFTAKSRADLPAVGDWVAFAEYDSNKALIHATLPRKSLIERKSPGKAGEKQIIAANVDYALLIQALDRDFNLNRIERYLTLCYASQVHAAIIFSKTDLIPEEELQNHLGLLQKRNIQIPVFPVSNQTEQGYPALKAFFRKGLTYCMLGSSGVGKSTLLNNLSGKEYMATNTLSSSNQKGRHTTSHREMFLLKEGGILIDNPGMREVGITDSDEGLNTTFELILENAMKCRYKDCTHTSEAGCAVIEGVNEGLIDRGTYENYLKMEREKMYFQQSAAEKRKKDKDFGKFLKDFKKNKKYISNKHEED